VVVVVVVEVVVVVVVVAKVFVDGQLQHLFPIWVN